MLNVPLTHRDLLSTLFRGGCITTFLTSEIKHFLGNAAAFPACSSDTRGQVSLPANTQRQETAPQRAQARFGAAAALLHK